MAALAARVVVPAVVLAALCGASAARAQESPPSEPPAETTPEVRGTTSEVVTVDDEPSARPGPRRRRTQPIAYHDGRLSLHAGPVTLSPSGLLQFDGYSFFGPGVKDYQRPNGTGLETNLAGRRIRLELGGRVLEKWSFLIGVQAGGPGASGSPSPNVTPLNNFVAYEASPMLRVQVGQFRVPFTLDNVSGIRWSDFMERSLTASAVGAPLIRDLGAMVWGGTSDSAIWYALGYFGGEGGNRPSTDNRGDVIGRFVFRPLWKRDGAIRQLHVGVSGRYGRRDPHYTQYDAPAMSTPGGYTFWSPSYAGPDGVTHVQPSGDQAAAAAELFVPFRRFDVRAEGVWVHDERREVFAATRDNTERAGTLSGLSYYVQATWWAYGEPRIVGAPGHYGPPPEPPRTRVRALSLSARWEQVRLDYDSIDRSFRGDTLVPGVRRGGLDARTTKLRVDAVQLAATYYATQHVKVMAQWSLFRFPGEPGVDDQATAPGAHPNAPLDARARADVLHEVSGRVQLSF